MEYTVHGGVITINEDIELLDAHGGVFYVKGNVGKIVQRGGVLYDQRPSNRVEYRTDKMSEEERQRFRQRIAELEMRLNRSESECLMVRQKIVKEEAETPPDDVLVAKIEHLQGELSRERADRKKEVEELNLRLDAAIEALNDTHRNYIDAAERERRLSNSDDMIDVLATLVNLYPFTTDKDLSFEFGIKIEQVRYIAKILKLSKSAEARHEAADYLRRQHIEFIQRRGGDQGNHKPRTRQVEKVDKKGKVLASYKSIVDAANRTGCSSKTIQKYCLSEKTIYMKDGITFRYKKDDNTTKQSGGH